MKRNWSFLITNAVVMAAQIGLYVNNCRMHLKIQETLTRGERVNAQAEGNVRNAERIYKAAVQICQVANAQLPAKGAL